MRDSEKWYVHVLGPDDVLGPYTGFQAAMTIAMDTNMQLWFGRRYRPGISDNSWAVPTRSPNGIQDAKDGGS